MEALHKKIERIVSNIDGILFGEYVRRHIVSSLPPRKDKMLIVEVISSCTRSNFLKECKKQGIIIEAYENNRISDNYSFSYKGINVKIYVYYSDPEDHRISVNMLRYHPHSYLMRSLHPMFSVGEIISQIKEKKYHLGRVLTSEEFSIIWDGYDLLPKEAQNENPETRYSM